MILKNAHNVGQLRNGPLLTEFLRYILEAQQLTGHCLLSLAEQNCPDVYVLALSTVHPSLSDEYWSYFMDHILKHILLCTSTTYK